MGQIVIRGIPDDVLEAFKARAKSEGLAAETLARQLIIREAQRPSGRTYAEALAHLDRLRAMSPPSLTSSVADIRELRDNVPDGS